jgi:hypothetical protein
MGRMDTASDPRPYVVISSDTHAGASIQAYREYLDDAHKQLFDEWRGGYKNPQREHIGSKKHKNWDDAERMKDMHEEGVVGEIIFRTRCRFFRSRVLICGNPSVADYPLWREGIRAHNRWLAILATSTRVARGHRSGLSERHRRGDRGRAVDRQTRAARRRAHAARAARLHTHQTALRARLRPLLGGVPGPGRRLEPSRRHRLARLRPYKGRAADPAGGDGLVLDPQLHAPLAGRRVRALPKLATS